MEEQTNSAGVSIPQPIPVDQTSSNEAPDIKAGTNQNKHKTKKIIIISVLIIVVLAIGFIGWNIYIGFFVNPSHYNGPKLDSESKAFIDREAPLIYSNWNAQEMINMSDPVLLAATPPQTLRQYFQTYLSQYGIMQSYDGSIGQAGIFTFPGKVVIAAEYISKIRFTNSLALITSDFNQNNGVWQFSGVRVSPIQGNIYPTITPPLFAPIIH